MYSTRSCTADDSTLRFNTADDARKNFHHLKKTSHSSHLTFFLKCESISFGLHFFYISSKFSEIKFIGLGTCKFYKDKFCNFYNLVAFHLIKFLHPRLPSYITTTHFKGYFCFSALRRYAHTNDSIIICSKNIFQWICLKCQCFIPLFRQSSKDNVWWKNFNFPRKCCLWTSADGMRSQLTTNHCIAIPSQSCQQKPTENKTCEQSDLGVIIV